MVISIIAQKAKLTSNNQYVFNRQSQIVNRQ
jgi:hypothetical protein